MNFIHPTAILEEGCKLGQGNYIGPFCFIGSNVVIGDDNRFEGYCSVGTAAEHRDYFKTLPGKTCIGNNNVIREFVTINGGTVSSTIVSNNCIFLKGSHVGHDCFLEDKVTLSCGATIGGHCHIMEGSNFGLNSMSHQYSVIGAYSMLGMGAVVTKKTKVGCGEIFVGNPATFLKRNDVGLKNNGVTEEHLNKLTIKWENLRSNS